MLISYPFLLIIINIAINDTITRERYTFWFNVICGVLMLVLLYLHMQTEVVFGKDLLDSWYRNNPE
ncbi:hypothetical protein EDI28_05105 [Photobacterium chitinilyticum]|uniref:Uncharacterized protein n=1 Tax=Photobacterium chitinilyticum TaxID=2485123 RepID=A0A3S3RC02_9GAMM|nr:hypothetical protein EDI28_05105 [Photobacterium chitinilyticum]